MLQTCIIRAKALRMIPNGNISYTSLRKIHGGTIKQARWPEIESVHRHPADSLQMNDRFAPQIRPLEHLRPNAKSMHQPAASRRSGPLVGLGISAFKPPFHDVGRVVGHP